MSKTVYAGGAAERVEGKVDAPVSLLHPRRHHQREVALAGLELLVKVDLRRRRGRERWGER